MDNYTKTFSENRQKEHDEVMKKRKLKFYKKTINEFYPN